MSEAKSRHSVHEPIHGDATNFHAAERARQLTNGLMIEQLQVGQLRSESLLWKSSLPGREHFSHRAHRVSASP
jgi:hypothetical protein